MGTEDNDHGYDDMYRLLKSIETHLSRDGASHNRPTDTYYRPTRKMLDEQKKECTIECEKRLLSSEKTQCMKIQTLKEDVDELKKQLSVDVEKGRDEANKTHESFSSSFKIRIKHIEKTLYSGATGDLSARVLAVEGWLEKADVESEEAVDNSRFSKTFILATLAFLVPTAIAIAGLIVALFAVGKSVQ